jgi:hypothetical protein
MPFYEDKDLVTAPVQGQQPALETSTNYTLEQIGSAALGLNNALSPYELGGRPEYYQPSLEDVEGYNPFAGDIAGYEANASAFTYSGSPAETQRIKAQIDRENHAREVIAESGLVGFGASIGAAVLDPINMLPVGAIGKGATITEAAMRSAVGFGAATVADEAILQGQQVTRTAEESAFNIGGAVILGGLLGGATKYFKGSIPEAITDAGLTADARPSPRDGYFRVEENGVQRDVNLGALADEMRLAREMEIDGMRLGEDGLPLARTVDQEADDLLRKVANEGDGGMPVAGGMGGSLSAASVRDLSGNELAGSFGAQKLQLVPIMRSPQMEVMSSPSAIVRDAGERLTELSFVQKKNAGPNARASEVSAETLAQNWRFNQYDATRAVEDAFVEHRTGKPKGLGTTTALWAQDKIGRTPADKLTYPQFKEAVSMAMRRDDMADALPIPDAVKPLVTRAARQTREKMFSVLERAAKDVGLIGEDAKITTADSYLTRMWLHDKVIAQRPEFENVLTAALQGKQVSAAVDYEAALQKANKAENRLAELNEKIKNYNPADRKTLEKELRKARREFAQSQHALDKVRREAELLDARGLGSDAAKKEVPVWLKEELKAIRMGRTVPKPQSLTSWVVANGGVRTKDALGGRLDLAGEVEALRDSHKRVGFVNNGETGRSLDDLTLSAWENGFIGNRGGDRPEIADLLAALDEDVRGKGVYSDDAADMVARMENRADLEETFSRLDLDPKTMTDAEIADAMAIDVRGMAGDKIKAELSTGEALFKELSARVEKAKDDLAAHGTKPLLYKQKAAAEYGLEASSAKAEALRFLATADEADLKDIARTITDNVLGNTRESLAGVPTDAVSNIRGPLAQRVLTLVRDEEVEKWLNNDIDDIMRYAARVVGSDVEIARQFGRPDMKNVLESIREDYAIKRQRIEADNAASPEAKEKALTALARQEKRDIDNMADMRDRIRGTYGMPKNPEGIGWRALRVTRQLNHMTFMGGAALPASLSDVGRVVFEHGMGRFLNDGLIPLIKNLKQVRLNLDEVRLGGQALELSNDARMASNNGMDAVYGNTSKFERGMANLSRGFNTLNMMAPWTDTISTAAGLISQKRMLQGVEALMTGKPLADAERRWLAEMGIDLRSAPDVWAERAHWQSHNGLLQPNARDWGNQDAARRFIGGFSKAQRKAIQQPMQDKPLWMSNEFGATIGQFRSFVFSGTAKTTILGLQRRDSAVMAGMISMVGVGMLSYYLSMVNTGQELSDNPAVWIREGVDRSGVLGWIMEANAIMEKASGNNLGVGGMLGEAGTRTASTNVIGKIAGPTFGRLKDFADIFAGMSTGKWPASATGAVRRQIPLQNHFLLRHMFDLAEGGIDSRTQRR